MGGGLIHQEMIKSFTLSGYVNENILSYAEGLDQLRIFSSHGQDPTLPVEWARKGVALLKKKTLEVD